jgi:hypothetical protein
VDVWLTLFCLIICLFYATFLSCFSLNGHNLTRTATLPEFNLYKLDLDFWWKGICFQKPYIDGFPVSWL